MNTEQRYDDVVLNSRMEIRSNSRNKRHRFGSRDFIGTQPACIKFCFSLNFSEIYHTNYQVTRMLNDRVHCQIENFA